MRTLNIERNWDEVESKFEQKFADLTDNDLLLNNGQEKEFLGKHQKKYGKIREEIRTLLASLREECL
jgi:uncharacterized protein YjbJ (UPF0337 family)